VNQELNKIASPQSQINGAATMFLKLVMRIQIVVVHAKMDSVAMFLELVVEIQIVLVDAKL
jgi:hypothetical protein